MVASRDASGPGLESVVPGRGQRRRATGASFIRYDATGNHDAICGSNGLCRLTLDVFSTSTLTLCLFTT